MTQEQAMLTENILSFYWTEEEKHYDEGGKDPKHIFNSFLGLQAELDNFYHKGIKII